MVSAGRSMISSLFPSHRIAHQRQGHFAAECGSGKGNVYLNHARLFRYDSVDEQRHGPHRARWQGGVLYVETASRVLVPVQGPRPVGDCGGAGGGDQDERHKQEQKEHNRRRPDRDPSILPWLS